MHAEGRRCDAFHGLTSASGDAHAGVTETALLLALDPSVVRVRLAQAGERRPVSEMMDRLRREGVRSVSPNGILGDPRGATPAQGRRLLDELIAGCVQALDIPLLAQDPAHA